MKKRAMILSALLAASPLAAKAHGDSNAKGSGLDAVAILGRAAAAAYAYGVLAVLVPGAFPEELQNPHGLVEPRFEVGALLVVLALLVRWRRSRTLDRVEPGG